MLEHLVVWTIIVIFMGVIFMLANHKLKLLSEQERQERIIAGFIGLPNGLKKLFSSKEVVDDDLWENYCEQVEWFIREFNYLKENNFSCLKQKDYSATINQLIDMKDEIKKMMGIDIDLTI